MRNIGIIGSRRRDSLLDYDQLSSKHQQGRIALSAEAVLKEPTPSGQKSLPQLHPSRRNNHFT